MTKKVKALEKQLLSRIDTDDLMQVEKVERYINLVRVFNQLDEDIKEHGTTVVTQNGSQTFTKINPAVGEKVKISGALLNIEKTFGFSPKEDSDEGDGLL